MESIEFSISNETIQKMKKYYDSQMISSGDDLIFSAKAIGCQIDVTLDSRALFKGENALQEAARWSKKYQKVLKEKVIETHNNYDLPHIGTAETGSNDYVGPICFVSCYVNEDDINYIKSLNIDDVHSLTTQEIIQYAKDLKEKIKYGLLILDNSHYNKMVDEGLNLPSIKSKLLNQTTVNMMQKIKTPIHIKVMNHFVSPKTYYNYLKNDVAVAKDITFEENADEKYMAVLAAEILSQYAYLQYFSNMIRSLKIKLARGVNSDADASIVKVVNKYGDKILTKTTKINFPNTKKVKNILEKQK